MNGTYSYLGATVGHRASESLAIVIPCFGTQQPANLEALLQYLRFLDVQTYLISYCSWTFSDENQRSENGGRRTMKY